jgi:hypothetical protein
LKRIFQGLAWFLWRRLCHLTLVAERANIFVYSASQTRASTS